MSCSCHDDGYDEGFRDGEKSKAAEIHERAASAEVLHDISGTFKEMRLRNYNEFDALKESVERIFKGRLQL